MLEQTAVFEIERGRTIDKLDQKQLDQFLALVQNMQQKLGDSAELIQLQKRIVFTITEKSNMPFSFESASFHRMLLCFTQGRLL
ncbi:MULTISPECIES: hypothetical protein [Brevibacillus]|uniref:Uncharacterized protein n=1 Tax=Brevibacillus invocatus TaxID=173959 RepID=A0A3M8C166_9BACL|nr:MULTISPECIES: hypothetical protein [Brevibacillus]MDH4618715.1 hypothetical protein [Brevibacillus sp. AY1]RNB69404.1 hypothetical protein EDM52_19310 [Brevibacillus invocatus]